MNPGVNAADGKRREKIENEDSLRTVECLRGRLLAERVASRNAKEEVEQMENKLIELEKKLIEEYKSRNRAEKKLKFLMKKLQSMNIPYISCESEHSRSGSVERSEISSSVSSATSSSTKVVDEKENNVNATNSAIGGNIRENIQNSKLIPNPENLQQSVCSSSSGNRDNPATEKTNCSSNSPNSPQLTILKVEIKEFQEKKIKSPIQDACSFAENQENPAIQIEEKNSESSSISNNSQQNACSFAKNQENPAIQTEEENSDSSAISNHSEQNACSFSENQENPAIQIEGENSESSSISNNSQQNACSFAKNQENPAIQTEEENSDSSAISNHSEQNACSFSENQENPAIQIEGENSESSSMSNNSQQNACSFAKNQENPAIQTEEENSDSSAISNNSQENPRASAEYHDKSAAGEGTAYANCVNFLELIMKIEIETESPVDSFKCEQNASSSSAKDHDTPSATETIISRNSFNFPKLAGEINESPAVSIESEQNACTINQFHGSPRTHQEIDSRRNEPQSCQKPKKHDRSLRTLFKKEKLLEEANEEEPDEQHQEDNSLALVPVDLPKPKSKQQSIDPEILDATVKEVLGSLRNAKEKLQTSMERRRSNMIKVG